MTPDGESPLRRRRHYRITRDGVLFASGLLGVTHETFFSASERPFLLTVFGAMMGMPLFIRMDEKRRDGGE